MVRMGAMPFWKVAMLGFGLALCDHERTESCDRDLFFDLGGEGEGVLGSVGGRGPRS